MKADAYKKAGVDLNAAEETLKRIKPLARRTLRPEVMGGLGGFGGLFELKPEKWKNPVLVSGTDGVGTKLKLAFELQTHDTIGIDLVAMCVNDILVQGAEPLFFLDYLACGKLLPGQVERLVGGISEGCRQAGCALIGGETAEMPGMYPSEEYDLAGFAVGAVERDSLIDGSLIEPGDVLLGLSSSGIHSNGFSLVHKIIEQSKTDLNVVLPELQTLKPGLRNNSLGLIMLEPTRIYVRSVLKLVETITVKGMVHITGGGLLGNIPRMLPEGAAAELEIDSWPQPPIFTWLEQTGRLSAKEMLPVFNMGIGFVICVAAEHVEEALPILVEQGEAPRRIGRIISGNRTVSLN